MNNVLLEHLLTDHQNFLLVSRYFVLEPFEDLFATTAHGVLAEPAILVVLHLDVFVHDVGPLLQILKLVVLDLSAATAMLIVLGWRIALVLAEVAIIRVTGVIGINKINNLEHLVLNIVFVDEGEDLVLDCRKVSHLKDGWALVVVLVQ